MIIILSYEIVARQMTQLCKQNVFLEPLRCIDRCVKFLYNVYNLLKPVATERAVEIKSQISHKKNVFLPGILERKNNPQDYARQFRFKTFESLQ